MIQPDTETVLTVKAIYDKHLDALSAEVTALILEKTGYTPEQFGELAPGTPEFDATAAVVLDAHGTVGILLEDEGHSLAHDAASILAYFEAMDRKGDKLN